MKTDNAFYDIDGNPITMQEWLTKVDDNLYAMVDHWMSPDLPPVEVSTIWTGKSVLHPPMIFETKIFGGEFDGQHRKYATYGEAVIGHGEIVKKIKGG